MLVVYGKVNRYLYTLFLSLRSVYVYGIALRHCITGFLRRDKLLFVLTKVQRALSLKNELQRNWLSGCQLCNDAPCDIVINCAIFCRFFFCLLYAFLRYLHLVCILHVAEYLLKNSYCINIFIALHYSMLWCYLCFAVFLLHLIFISNVQITFFATWLFWKMIILT